MENKKLLTFVVIGLLLLNLGTLAFLWTGRDHPHGPPPPHEGGPALFLIHELGLNAEQQSRFEKLRDEHHQRMVQIQDSLHTLHETFFEGLSATTPLQTDSIAGLMGKKQSEIEKLTFDHFRKVRALCTPDQQKKFDSVIEEALRMMAPPPPR
jgi:protein CpxP